MRRRAAGIVLVMLAAAGVSAIGGDANSLPKEPNGIASPTSAPHRALAAVIPCEGMIDDGLYESIKRRTDIALGQGATYLIYEISTYGGMVKSADDIAKFLIHEAGPKARTVAYVTTEAISAGAMVSVSCQDIIMKTNTTIGDCAPIVLEGKLEGVEREKSESFVRATFERAAEVNHYPKAVLLAMVTQQLEVWRVKNLKTGKMEFFNTPPTDPNTYDIAHKELIDSKDTLLTMTASKALEYGVARAVVPDRAAALAFLEKRDNVKFAAMPAELGTNWSEEMVRWLNSPVITSILFMLGLAGIYMELNHPGTLLPALLAIICFGILFGSKFLVGLANWAEIAAFVIGVLLIFSEILLHPGTIIPGAIGVLLIMFGLVGLLIQNKPGEIPIPKSKYDLQLMINNGTALAFGFLGFLVIAYLFMRHVQKIRFLSGLVMEPAKPAQVDAISMTVPPETPDTRPVVGDAGVVISPLRPAGKARFGPAVVDVVAEGAFIAAGANVKIVQIVGNRVVVRETK